MKTGTGFVVSLVILCAGGLVSSARANASTTDASTTDAHKTIPPSLSSGAGDLARVRTAALQGTCAHVIASYLDRMAQRDGRLHAIIAVNPAARAEADRIDRLPDRTRKRMPLLCAPLLVKDNIDVAGMPTTAGSAALSGNLAPRDATAVARLKAAGAVVVAKTNMSEFAFNYRGRSSVAGQTSSPFSFAESAGGSSSGNGAALAAGFGVIALGTDTSGSLRVPAALTGTVGVRPSFGLVPKEGVLPLSPSQDVIGPMCRTLLDCATVLAVLAPAAWKGAQGRTLKGLRVGVLSSFLPTDLPALKEAVAALRTAGASVSQIRLRDEYVLVGRDPPSGETALFASRSAFDFPEQMDRYLPGRSGVPENAGALVAALKREAQAGRTDPRVVADVEKFTANHAGAGSDPRARVNGAFRDRFVAERIDEAFDCAQGRDCIDVLIYPSVQTATAPLASGPDTAGTHRLAAYSGRAAVALPVGATMTEHGLRPVSLEMMMGVGDDMVLLALAAQWQERLSLPRTSHCGDEADLVCLESPEPIDLGRTARRH